MSQSVVTNYFTKKRRGGYIQPSKRLKLSNDVGVISMPTYHVSKEKVPAKDVIIQPDKVAEQIREAKTQSKRKQQTRNQPRRSSRRTRKNSAKDTPAPSLDDYLSQHMEPVTENLDDITLRLSPSSCGSSLCGSMQDVNEIITAADDNHDIPVTPSKRQKKNRDETLRQKRGRISPKKSVGYEFSADEKSNGGELTPNLEFTMMRTTRRKARKKLLSSEEKGDSDDSAKSEEKSRESSPKNVPTVPNSAKENNKNLNAQQVKTPAKTVEKEKPEKGRKTRNARKTEKAETEQNVEKPVRKTRSRKNATSENVESDSKSEKSSSMKKTEDLAKRLLAKKLDSPDSVKQALKGTNKLKDLQETLMKIRDQKKKRQEKEKVQKPKIKEIEKKVKEVKVHEKREFAYETLHSLAQEVPKGLPLPFKYKVLAEMFRCADTVVGMLFNRQQITTWNNLQKSVKDMIRKNFELDHLGQIKTVFPSAYQYRQEKGIMSYTDHIRPADYQLTIEPILDERECDQFGDGTRKLTSSMLVKRRHHFMVQLVEVVKEHHKKFLSTLDPPMEVEDEKILRWHPQFPLDRVPDLEVADLPKPPNQDKEKCHSAKDVLDKARNKFTKKAVDALKKVAEKASLTPEKSKPVVEENNNITPVKPQTPTKPATALKGVSQSLLAKIRAKEAEKKMKSMVRTDEADKKLQQLMKLPDVARALRMLFVTEKKAALQLDYIADKLVKCCTGILAPDIVVEHVQLLMQHVPSWISQTKVRNVSYIRMNKTKEMAEIVAEIQVKIKQAEKA